MGFTNRLTLMKKILTVAVAALLAMCSGALQAQTAQYSIDLEPFSGVAISGPFEVSLVHGTQYRALITVLEPYKEYVVCSVSGGILKLDLDEKKVPSEIKKQFRGKGTPDPIYKAVVYVPELLRSVELSEKAVLHDTEDLFDKARVTFSLEGNSSIKSMNISSLVFVLDMKGKSSADFAIDGRKCEVSIAGSSSLNLKAEEEECELSLQGSSKLEANCRAKKFSLSAKGNSNSTITGTADEAVFQMAGTSEANAQRMDVAAADVQMSSVCTLSINAIQTLKVNLNGGSTLLFGGEPSIIVDNIRSATMSRLKTLPNSSGRL